MAAPAHLDEATAEPLRLTAGLNLLGPDPADGELFLARRGDGQVTQLAQLPYLVAVAIAEAAMATGAMGRGVPASLVAARMSAQLGQEITAATVRSFVVGQLAPLGLVTTGTPDPAPASLLAVVSPGQDRPYRNRPRRRTVALGAAAALLTAGATLALLAVTGAGPVPAPAPADQVKAAAWVAQEVSPGSVVSCDPATCGLVRQHGFPAAQLEALGAGTRDPLGSAVVIATPAVRSQFGARLGTVYAPVVLASFGTGDRRVEVRAIAPGGAAAY
jgi:hypothetical protein